MSVARCLYIALAEREHCELVTADDKLLRNVQPHSVLSCRWRPCRDTSAQMVNEVEKQMRSPGLQLLDAIRNGSGLIGFEQSEHRVSWSGNTKV